MDFSNLTNEQLKLMVDAVESLIGRYDLAILEGEETAKILLKPYWKGVRGQLAREERRRSL